MNELKKAVYRANMALQENGLVLFTWGNVSGIDRAKGIVAIKPSGVPYEKLTPDQIVLVSLESGNVVQGTLNPSSDTATHLELYRAFPCGAVVHTHSAHATTLAQASLPVRCMGTTQADYFHGDIPVTRPLTDDEIEHAYEKNTGLVIAETFAKRDSMAVPGVLVAHHGPFAWGKDPADAVHNATVLEYVARMEIMVRAVRPDAPIPTRHLVDKHYLRKHGDRAYYGQSG